MQTAFALERGNSNLNLLMSEEEAGMAESQADIRRDLVRRLFAVAISVGAASTLSEMDWVTDGRAPMLQEWQQVSILVVAMIATVLSWDGYLASTAQRPLQGFWRFAIDIALVFIYMFLLMTSRHLTWWLPIHAGTYILYVLWDLLSVREYLSQYDERTLSEEPEPPQTVVGVYSGGFLNRAGISRGPIITVSWAIYFCILTWLSHDGLRNRIFITSILAGAGLIFYRRDKRLRYPMLLRGLLIGVLAGAAYLYARYGATLGLTDDRFWKWVGPYIGPAYLLP